MLDAILDARRTRRVALIDYWSNTTRRNRLGNEMKRRDFCVAVGAGLVVIGLPGCGGEGRANGGGGNPFGDDGGGSDGADGGDGGIGDPEDLAGAGPEDLAGPHDFARSPDLVRPPDLAAGGCTGKGFLATKMKPASFTSGTATFIFIGQSQLFVCRDANGLYALTAICTH